MAEPKIKKKKVLAIEEEPIQKDVIEDEGPQVSLDEMSKEELIAAAQSALENAKSKADVVAVWKKYYYKVGHRNMGRILIGTFKGGE